MGFGLDAFGKNLNNQVTSGFAGYTPKGLANTAKGIPGMLGNTILNKVTGAITDFVTAPNLRDFTHADRIFHSASYQNAPKQKHLFHVHFGLSRQLIGELNSSAQANAQNPNHGILVKSVDLPKFQTPLQEMNQYNRKRYVQTKVTYDPIKIQFHDDGGNAINSLWFAYFTYYYRDSANWNNESVDAQMRQGYAFGKRSIYFPDMSDEMSWGFNGEIEKALTPENTRDFYGTKIPFFRYISIFSLNQKTFTEYRLMNPIIESFGHDGHDYSSGNGVMENSMTIRFESVQYYSNVVGPKDKPNVPGFGNAAIYDTTDSPAKEAGSSNSIDGEGGLLASVGNIKGAFSPNGSYLSGLRGLARTATTFKNPETLLSSGMSFLGNKISGKNNSRNIPFTFPKG